MRAYGISMLCVALFVGGIWVGCGGDGGNGGDGPPVGAGGYTGGTGGGTGGTAGTGGTDDTGGTGGEAGGTGGDETGGVGSTAGEGGEGGSGGGETECDEGQTVCGTECCDNETQVCAGTVCEAKPVECEVGTACAPGKVCNASKDCVAGCLIEDEFLAHGTAHPTNPCLACSAANELDWSGRVGEACDEGKMCDAIGQCVVGCLIAGAVYEDNEPNPSNACVVCDVDSDKTGWTPAGKQGQQCDDGKYCNTADECVAGCLIGAESLAHGDPHPDKQCLMCSPANATAWSPREPGTDCTEGGGTICNAAGACIVMPHVSAGDEHTCSVSNTTGAAKCWGLGDVGRLGTNNTTTQRVPTAVYNNLTGISAVSAGASHTCALTDAGAVRCWGSNASRETSSGTAASYNAPQNAGPASAIAVAAGDQFSCAITPAGAVMCWGNGGQGRLGIGSQANSSTPVQASGLGQDVEAIALGSWHACALIKGGSVKCWGYNSKGQLGDGTATDRWSPQTIPSLNGVVNSATAIVAGQQHTCAITTTGAMMCWGANTHGQIGDSSTLDRSEPKQVTGLTSGVTAIAAGLGHTCAVLDTQEVKCWGYNDNGQLGDKTRTKRNAPTLIDGFTGVVEISAGGSHTCAVRKTGSVECWGKAQNGQLGIGASLEDQLYPAPVNPQP